MPPRAGRRWRHRTWRAPSRCCSSAGIQDAGAPGLFDDVQNRLCATANVGWGVQSLFGNTQITPSDPRYPNWFGCGVVDAGEAVLGLNPPPPNDPPVATADTATATEDTAGRRRRPGQRHATRTVTR